MECPKCGHHLKHGDPQIFNTYEAIYENTIKNILEDLKSQVKRIWSVLEGTTLETSETIYARRYDDIVCRELFYFFKNEKTPYRKFYHRLIVLCFSSKIESVGDFLRKFPTTQDLKRESGIGDKAVEAVRYAFCERGIENYYGKNKERRK